MSARVLMYVGHRTWGGCLVERVEVLDGITRTAPLAHVVRHSPGGFEWGYSGSGPADLALFLCRDALDDEETADAVYQAFKWRYVANWKEAWSIDRETIRHFAADFIEKREGFGETPARTPAPPGAPGHGQARTVQNAKELTA